MLVCEERLGALSLRYIKREKRDRNQRHIISVGRDLAYPTNALNLLANINRYQIILIVLHLSLNFFHFSIFFLMQLR